MPVPSSGLNRRSDTPPKDPDEGNQSQNHHQQTTRGGIHIARDREEVDSPRASYQSSYDPPQLKQQQQQTSRGGMIPSEREPVEEVYNTRTSYPSAYVPPQQQQTSRGGLPSVREPAVEVDNPQTNHPSSYVPTQQKQKQRISPGWILSEKESEEEIENPRTNQQKNSNNPAKQKQQLRASPSPLPEQHPSLAKYPHGQDIAPSTESPIYPSHDQSTRSSQQWKQQLRASPSPLPEQHPSLAKYPHGQYIAPSTESPIYPSHDQSTRRSQQRKQQPAPPNPPSQQQPPLGGEYHQGHGMAPSQESPIYPQHDQIHQSSNSSQQWNQQRASPSPPSQQHPPPDKYHHGQGMAPSTQPPIYPQYDQSSNNKAPFVHNSKGFPYEGDRPSQVTYPSSKPEQQKLPVTLCPDQQANVHLTVVHVHLQNPGNTPQHSTGPAAPFQTHNKLSDEDATRRHPTSEKQKPASSSTNTTQPQLHTNYVPKPAEQDQAPCTPEKSASNCGSCCII